MKPHKWQKEILAWANGETIQVKDMFGFWCDTNFPNWDEDLEYRIKPELKIEYTFDDKVKEDIEDILDAFNFQRVLETMNALHWTYWYTKGVPEIWDVRKEARIRLKEAVKGLIRFGGKRYYSSSGGFHAQAEIEEGDPKIYLSLKFVVSEWDNFDE